MLLDFWLAWHGLQLQQLSDAELHELNCFVTLLFLLICECVKL
jgi:hypothetical protein